MLLALPQRLRIKWLVKNGLRLGINCYIAPSVLIDPTFPWLISIGDNCYLTFNVTILAHDASTKNYIDYTKIGAVTIGNNCFVGAGSIILPNVHIGDNVIIGAGSVITHDISKQFRCRWESSQSDKYNSEAREFALFTSSLESTLRKRGLDSKKRNHPRTKKKNVGKC